MSARQKIIEAIASFPFHNFGLEDVDPRSDTAEWVPVLADAVLAAVLPVHRQQVLAEVADSLQPGIDRQQRRNGDARDTDKWTVMGKGRLMGMRDAQAAIRGLAETHPATGPGSTQPAQDALAVAEEAPDAPGPTEGARDARAIAHTWLTWAITRAASTAQGNREIADAILNTLGVEIEIDRIKRMPQELGDDEPLEIRNPPTGMRPTHTQVVIRLPAQPIEDGRDG